MKTNSSAELASAADTIAVSERAKRQIGAQASQVDPTLRGTNFVEGFPDGPPAPRFLPDRLGKTQK
jgi:hypothetical protein